MNTLPPNHPGENEIKSKVRLVAFYLPQFHPIKENDEWWGQGFTEWTNVTKAEPLFPGHYQPQLPTDLGFYDLRLRESRRAQIRLAQSYGIDAFCYYYYWFSGKRLLEAPLEDMLADAESDMPFCLCWANENWSRRWNGSEHDVLIKQQHHPEDALRFIQDITPYISDSRYLKVDGKPILIVYRPQLIHDIREVAATWRTYCRSIGIGEVHLCAALVFNNLDYEQFGFDSGVEFPPHNRDQLGVRYVTSKLRFYRPFKGGVMMSHELANAYLNRDVTGRNIFRGVFTSWDNTARRKDTALLFLNSTPGNYEFWLDQTIKKTQAAHPGEDRLVFINAWNEWAEGCHLEPDNKFHKGFLEATLRARRGNTALKDFPDTELPKESVASFFSFADELRKDFLKYYFFAAARINGSARSILAPLQKLQRFLRRSRSGENGMLIIAHDAALYGAQHSLLDIIRRLDRNKYDLLVVAPSSGAFTEALHGLKVPFLLGIAQRWIFHPRPMAFLAILKRPWRFIRLRKHPYTLTLLSFVSLPIRVLLLAMVVRIKGIRVIYTNTVAVLDGALVAWLCRIPHVWHLREPVAGNLDLAYPFSASWVPAFILRWSTRVIVNSQALGETIFGGSIPSKVQVIHNGVDLERYRNPMPAGDLDRYPPNARLVGICGAIQERKDILTFVCAAARLQHSFPDVHYLIVGKEHGPYYKSVKQEIANSGLETCVHFLGYRSDIPEIFARIDILVSAAREEPFGRTIIEAMAAGKPVVSTRSGGPQEIIEDGISGFLVDVGDDVAMAARLSELLSNHDLLTAMGAAARQRATECFDLNKTVKCIENVFDNVLKDA